MYVWTSSIHVQRALSKYNFCAQEGSSAKEICAKLCNNKLLSKEQPFALLGIAKQEESM